MSLGMYGKVVEVGGGETVVVLDGVQSDPFFDLNVHVVPKDNFTGDVKFYIGDDVAKVVTYNNENGSCVFAPTNPEYPEIFPPTVERTWVHKDVMMQGMTGRKLRAKVEIINSGMNKVVFEVFFMRKYK